MTHHSEEGDPPGFETSSGPILVAFVRAIMFPVLAMGFVCWILVMAGSLAVVSVFEVLNLAFRGMRSLQRALFPMGDRACNDIEIGCPEMIEKHPIG